MTRKPILLSSMPPLWTPPAPMPPSDTRHNGGPPLEPRRRGRPTISPRSCGNVSWSCWARASRCGRSAGRRDCRVEKPFINGVGLILSLSGLAATGRRLAGSTLSRWCRKNLIGCWRRQGQPLPARCSICAGDN